MGDYLDPIENGCIEDVETSIDFVRHVFAWLFNEPFDAAGRLLIDHDTILRWLVDFRHLIITQIAGTFVSSPISYHDRAFASMSLMEFDHLIEWKLADHIRIENEKWIVIIVEEITC